MSNNSHNNPLGPNHFLSLPRPDVHIGPPAGVPDTTTLAAHDFDVDNQTGFMPPQAPISKLPDPWTPWEHLLHTALSQKLTRADTPHISRFDLAKSESWRKDVQELAIISIDDLKKSEVLLRRAHLVLAWLLHLYVHTLPLDAPVIIPAPLSIPLLHISAELQLPPVLTYSDTVLYNWQFASIPSTTTDNDELIMIHDGHPNGHPYPDPIPTLTTPLRCTTTFTNTPDEHTFYLTSALIELRGVAALDLMRATMDEVFVGDDIAIRRITSFLSKLATVIRDLRVLLMTVRDGCDPWVFYNEIRPWLMGVDSDAKRGRKWVFEGVGKGEEELCEPKELSGPSAAQSSLIHALDIFLGVDKYSHAENFNGAPPPADSTSTSSSTPPHDSASSVPTQSSFLHRMQQYMPRHHRNFLNHLRANPRPLRKLVVERGGVEGGEDGKALMAAYNEAVVTLKEFRDAHIVLVALYIVGPSRRVKKGKTEEKGKVEGEKEPLSLVGTGGTDLTKFLKGVRDQTLGAVIHGNRT